MGLLIRGDSLADSWTMLLAKLLRTGKEVSPRGKKVREVLNVQVEAPMDENLIVHPVRDLNFKFAVAEWLWISFGHNETDVIARYNKRMREFSDDGVRLYGAYGPRWREQFGYALNTLEKDADTRQAVVEIWKPNPRQSRDIPCTLSMQFFVRSGSLQMTVNMRSSDAWLGLPYDFFTFSQLGNILAGLLQVGRGWLTMNLGSSHLYEEHFLPAYEVLDHREQPRSIRSPSLSRYPSVLLNEILINPDSKYDIGELHLAEKAYARVLSSPKDAAREILDGISRFD